MHRTQRQHIVFVLQQNNAALGELLCRRVALLHVRHLLHHRMIEQTRSKDGTQNAVHVVVDLILRNFAAFHGLLQRIAEEHLAWLLLVQTRMRSLHRRVRATPVRQHKTFELEVLLQHIRQQVAVLARKVAIHTVIRAHHAARVRDAKRDLKRTQISLAHSPLADVRVHCIAAALLIVHRVVLQVANDVLRLHALCEVARQCSGQQRILSLVLKRAPVTRLARHVHTAAQRHAVPLVAQLASDQRAIFKRRLWIPCRRCTQVVRQRSGVAPGRLAARHAIRRVRHLNCRNSEPRNRLRVSSAAIRFTRPV